MLCSFVVTGEPGSQVESTFNRRYVMKKLEYGRLRIWQDVQQKVKIFVLGTDISEFKLEEFISVLDLINRCSTHSNNTVTAYFTLTPQQTRNGFMGGWLSINVYLGCTISVTCITVNVLCVFVYFRMIEIGEEFCKSKSEGLQDSLKQQSLNYFRNHHR